MFTPVTGILKFLRTCVQANLYCFHSDETAEDVESSQHALANNEETSQENWTREDNQGK